MTVYESSFLYNKSLIRGNYGEVLAIIYKYAEDILAITKKRSDRAAIYRLLLERFTDFVCTNHLSGQPKQMDYYVTPCKVAELSGYILHIDCVDNFKDWKTWVENTKEWQDKVRGNDPSEVVV